MSTVITSHPLILLSQSKPITVSNLPYHHTSLITHRNHFIPRAPHRPCLCHTHSFFNTDTPHSKAPQTRLQREALTIVSLDVEYCHIKILSTNKLLQLPTEVSLIDYGGNELVRSTCNALLEIAGEELASDHSLWSFAGGTPHEDWIHSPSLTMVQSLLIKEITGKPVVGHNLVKDLTALGLDHVVPQQLRRDTMRYPVLQTARGFGSTLADLTERKLGRRIQVEKRHDPKEDALAALELYLEFCHFDPSLMDYDDLVEYYASEMLHSPSPSTTLSTPMSSSIDDVDP